MADIIIVATIIVLLLGFFLVLFALAYVKRKNFHRMEKQQLQQQFRQTLLESQLEIQEQTFNHISREIHDNVGQLLSLAKVQVSLMEQSAVPDRQLLVQLRENIGSAMSDLRDIAKSLSSDRLAGLGLPNAIQQEAERINRSTHIHVAFVTDGNETIISNQKQLIVFRIIQECLQNMIKHSEASNASIFLNYGNADFQVIIQDNGRGFDLDAARENNKGMGLQNIFQRTTLISGSAEITSIPGKGTKIKLIIPYE